MQITSLFSAVPAVLNSGLKLIGVDIEGEIGVASPDPKEPAEPASSLDFSSITPDEFSELIDRLRSAGRLSAAGYRDLLGVRLELDRARAPHDQPVDVVALLQAKLAERQSAVPGDVNQELTRRQLQLLSSLGQTQGINALI